MPTVAQRPGLARQLGQVQQRLAVAQGVAALEHVVVAQLLAGLAQLADQAVHRHDRPVERPASSCRSTTRWSRRPMWATSCRSTSRISSSLTTPISRSGRTTTGRGIRPPTASSRAARRRPAGAGECPARGRRRPSGAGAGSSRSGLDERRSRRISQAAPANRIRSRPRCRRPRRAGPASAALGRSRPIRRRRRPGVSRAAR